jgi:hypothetical protein
MTPEPGPRHADFFDRHPLVVLLLLTLAFYWKLALSNQFTYLETPDVACQVLPWYQSQARAFHSGVFPLWDPYQWSGQSVLGQMQPGAAFPLNWPLFFTPLRDGYLNFAWVHRHFVLIHLLAAWFMYAFCRQVGSSRFASIIAGAAFSFAGYVGTIAWPQMLHGAIWIPLVFLFFHRMVECGWSRAGVANASLSGAALGIAFLSGHHQTPSFTAVALTGVFVYYLVLSAPPRWRLCALFAVVAAFAFLLGAAQILPGAEYGAHAYRWVGMAQPVRMPDTVPYFAQYDYGIFPLSLLGTIFPKAHLTTDPFLGFLCLSFAFFAVAAGWSQQYTRLYAGLALGALAYAAGHYSVFHGLVYTSFPLMDKARSPGHAIFVFQFAVLVLTARGLDLMLGPQQPDWERWRSRIIKTLVAIGLLAWGLLFWLYLNLKFEINPGDHVILSSLVAFLLAALLYGFHRGHLTPGSMRVSLVLLLLFELSITSYFFISHRDDPKRSQYLKYLTEARGLTEFLKSQPRPFRFDVASEKDFPANLGDWEGLESTRGYLASVSAQLYDFMGWDWGRATLLMNTVYVIAREPARPEQEEVYADPGGWKVFRNPDAFPRVWVAERVRQARDSREAAAWFRSGTLDARRETFLISPAEPPALESCPSDASATLTWHGLHRLAARVDTPCTRLVVFAEPHFPGWQARVDGLPAPLYAPFGALRGVVVPGGTHTVELVYRPASVYLGAALSLLGLAGCAGLIGFSRPRASR